MAFVITFSERQATPDDNEDVVGCGLILLRQDPKKHGNVTSDINPSGYMGVWFAPLTAAFRKISPRLLIVQLVLLKNCINA